MELFLFEGICRQIHFGDFPCCQKAATDMYFRFTESDQHWIPQDLLVYRQCLPFEYFAVQLNGTRRSQRTGKKMVLLKNEIYLVQCRLVEINSARTKDFVLSDERWGCALKTKRRA